MKKDRLATQTVSISVGSFEGRLRFRTAIPAKPARCVAVSDVATDGIGFGVNPPPSSGFRGKQDVDLRYWPTASLRSQPNQVARNWKRKLKQEGRLADYTKHSVNRTQDWECKIGSRALISKNIAGIARQMGSLPRFWVLAVRHVLVVAFPR